MSKIKNLAGLAAWRSRPEGDIEPIKTNWTVTPSNDNAAPEETSAMDVERSWRMTPSVDEIMRQVASGPEVRNEAGQIIGIGKLRFSDGNQKERAYTRGPEGKIIMFDAPMPAGAMLNTRDNAEASLGGTGFTQEQIVRSNIDLATILGVDYPVHRRFKRKERAEPIMTQAEQLALLDEARASGTMPPVTVCSPGIASGSPRPLDGYVGMKKGRKGESGSIAWEDVASAKAGREIWDAALAAMNADDRKALDAASEARTLADISPGGHPRAARRRGKRQLLAANDNLMAAIKAAA